MNLLNNFPISGRVTYCLQLIKSQKLKGKILVDIGSTFGWLENNLQHENLKEIIGVEPDKNAYNFSKRNIKHANFFRSDAANLPLQDNYADIAVFFDVIEHVQKSTEVKVLKEINRILKKSGLLLLSTPNNHILNNLLDPAWYFGHRHYKYDDLKSLLNKSGFKIIIKEKRGGLISLIYMLWFYFNKRLFKSSTSRHTFLEKLDNFSYRNPNGIITHYILAQKI